MALASKVNAPFSGRKGLNAGKAWAKSCSTKFL